MAFEYPDLFVAGAALSPAIYREGPPATSSARKQAQFQKNGSYDEALWRSLNYPRYVEQYRNQSLRIPRSTSIRATTTASASPSRRRLSTTS